MRQKGKLVKWDENKAFGFIAPYNAKKHVFIHKTAFRNKSRLPKVGDIITFSTSSDKDGRHYACDATFTGEKLKVKEAKKANRLSIYASIAFLTSISVACFFGELRHEIFWGYFGLSIFTFIVFAFDKSKAQRRGWRTRESTLHVLSLVGGWPGAAFAQQLFRHKSSKKPFQVAYWITVLTNIVILIWLVSSVDL